MIIIIIIIIKIKFNIKNKLHQTRLLKCLVIVPWQQKREYFSSKEYPAPP
jgi:hypothetical protein